MIGDKRSQTRSDLLRRTLLELSTPTKRLIGLTVDLLLVPSALWLAFLLRLGTDRLINPIEYYWLFLAAPVTAIPIFVKLGLYRAVLRYLGRDAVTTILKAVTIAALLLALVIYLTRSSLLIPRTLVFNYWLLLFALVGGVRFLARAFLLPDFKDRSFRALMLPSSRNNTRRRVAIYGAGAAGFQLYRSIQHDKDIQPVAFIDDDVRLHGRLVGSLRVFRSQDLPLLIKQTGTSEVFLAIPSLSPSQRRKILAELEKYQLHVRTVPSVYELTTGRKEVAQLEEIRVEDILGRDVVAPDLKLMQRCVTGKVVMVTGAGGSIGSELCRQIVELNPESLVLFEHSEFNLFTIEEELRADIERRNLNIRLYAILGSILDPAQLENAMTVLAVNTIYHAAAYKHVPIVEHNMTAGLHNNVFGTLHSARAAIAAKVDTFVLISTDKAVRPTNVMGASKRLSELILQALAKETAPAFYQDERDVGVIQQHNRTRFTMVRFGNVLGSSGSVIPKFRSQISQGGPVTVTHPEVTRFFMTIPEAAQLVIQASSMGTGGEVFVLDMGEPVPILQLAMKMIRLSGLQPRYPDRSMGDIDITFTGLRPGEKLYEELIIGEDVLATGHPKICRAEERFLPWEELRVVLSALRRALERSDLPTIRQTLTSVIDGYRPHDEIVDWTVPAATGPRSGDNNVVSLNSKLS